MGNFHGRGAYPMRMLIDNDEYEYDTCDWCGWWGYFGPGVPAKYELRDVNRCGELFVLCLRCFKLDEPPWRPNNRDRCHEWVVKVCRGSRIAALSPPIQRLIAEMLAENKA